MAKTALRIREICKEKGIKQKDLAQVLGLTETSLSTAINEGRFNVASLEKIASALDVSVPELFSNYAGQKKSSVVCPNCGTEIQLSLTIKVE